MTDRRVKVSLALLVSTLAVTSQLGRADAGVQTHLGSVALQGASMDNMMGLGNVSQCVLLFGAYCNGNMGDVIQASAMARLVADVSSDAQCVWHAHPSKEDSVNGFHEGDFFASDSSGGLIALGCDRASGQQASRFKSLVIGGGGLFESRHWPLDCPDFTDGLREDLPVSIFGVGANGQANYSAPIIQRADYVSGRDTKSVRAFQELLGRLDNPRTRPEDVVRVRDPVLSDDFLRDTEGKCWRQSEGLGKPLCFVLPSAMTKELEVFHHVLSTQVVVEKDILLNVFPKHQAEITAYSYPAEVEQVLDPVVFAKRLCGCRAVIASRLHGAVIALQTGVPTIAAWPVSEGNKVPNLMNDVLGLSDQFLRVHESLSRRDLIDRVSAVRKAYSRGRRELLFDKLASISDHTREESARVLLKVAGSRQAHEEAGVDAAEGEPEERLSREEEKEKEKGAGENQAQPGIELENVVTAPASGGYEKPPTIEIELVSSTGNVHEEVSLPEVTGARANQRSEGMAPGPSNPAIDGGSDGDFSQHKGGEGSSVIRGSASAPRPQAGREIPFAGSLIVSVIALLSMALLTLPGLASLPRDGRKETAVAGSSPKGDKASLPNKVAERLLDGGLVMKASLYRRVLGDRRIRAADVLFFGVNYTVWVTLAMGFNVCSKAYMHETRNPMALLTMQGWVGVVVLGVMNLIGKFRHRRHHVCAVPDAAFTEERSSFSPSSSLPLSRFSWLARYVPAKVRHVELSVWQAGVMHSCNAVLTSWSVLVGGVAATHALKALEPVAAAGFARWLLGSRLPPGCTAGVGIIVLGLGILMMPLHLPHWAGGSEGAVQYSGMDLAIPAVVTACSCCAVALRNVFLKKPNPPPPPPLGLLVCSVVGAWVGTVALLVPFLPWSWEWSGVCLLRTSGLNAALCFMGYNLASFNLLSELSPVGHAVGNASKRVCLFATGLFLLGEEGSMSPKQLAGASIAFMGLASYSLAGTYARSRSPLPR